jgi:nucleotide-binding universal stress UspA family protein
MKNILLCTDCSENAKRAADYCLQLFQTQTSNYFLLYTYFTESNEVSDLVAYNDSLKSEVTLQLQAELKRIQQMPLAKGIALEAQAIFGKTENVVKRFVANFKVDLVVLGMQGANYSDSQQFGSTSWKVLLELKQTKLLVPLRRMQSNHKKKLLLIQEKSRLNVNYTSTLSEKNKQDALPYKMMILPYAENTIDPIEKTVFTLTKKGATRVLKARTQTEVTQSLCRLIQSEKPDLLHFRLIDPSISAKLLSEDLTLSSLFGRLPLLIQA